MESQSAVILGQEALWQVFHLALPILGVGLAVGLVIGLFQVMTQIQEQTLPLVAKLAAMTLAVLWFLPWMTGQLLEYARYLIENISENLTAIL